MNSKVFQSVSLNPGEVVDILQKAKIRLQELRSPQEFERLLSKVSNLGLQQEPCEKRARMAPSKCIIDFVMRQKVRIESGGDGTDKRCELLQPYYVAIDAVLLSLSERFDQADLQPMFNSSSFTAFHVSFLSFIPRYGRKNIQCYASNQIVFKNHCDG